MRNIQLIITISLFIVSVGAEDAPETVRHFKISMHGDGDGPAPDVRLYSDIEVCYSRRQRSNVIEVWCDSSSNKGRMNEKLMHDFSINRTKWINQQGDGPRQEFTADQDPQLREVLEDSFGKPLVTFEVDAKGIEGKKAYSTAPGAKMILQNASIENCTLFHGMTPPNDATWTRRIDYSNGGPGSNSFKGEFHYELEASGTNTSLKSYKVSGTLTCDAIAEPDGKILAVKDKMVFEGTQVYDTSLKEWISGAMKNTLTMHFPGEKEDKFSTCVFTIRHELLKDK